MLSTLTACIYKWRSGSFNVPAQVVGEELAKLEIKPGEFHRTKDVLEEARDPNSPLHGCFPWDDEEAAEAHRLHMCRSMLRSIAIVIVREDKRVTRPVYVHVTDDEGPRYVKADKVARNEGMKAKAIDEVLAMLNGIRKRFEFISELAPVFEAIEDVARQRRRRRTRR